MTEFLVLDEGQAQLLTEPLKETWRRWRTHIESLRECAERLKGDLVFEETEISGSAIFIPIFPTSFGDDEASEGAHKKGSLSWKVEGERIDVKFSVEHLSSFKQLVIHFPELDIWVQLEELKGRLKDAIKNTAVDSKLRLERVSGIQPLAVKIVDGLGELLYYPPHMKRCDHCPDSAPGVFPLQRTKSTN